MDNNHFSSLKNERAQASGTQLGTRPASGHRTCQKCQSRQQHLIFTISAMGAILPSAPALENRKSEARNRCAQVRWGEYQRNGTCQLPQRAFVSSQHFQVSKLLSDSLSLLSRKGIVVSRCEGKRDQSYAYSISVSPSPVSPKANLSAISFTCHLPGVEICRGGGAMGGKGKDNCSLTGPTPQRDDQDPPM